MVSSPSDVAMHGALTECGSPADYSLSVTILRKETLILRTDSTSARDRLITDCNECIETASMRTY